MHGLLGELRRAARLLCKSPGFSTVAVLALALGIGANVSIFSVVDAVLLRPLPYPDPDRLIRLGRRFPTGVGYSISIPKFMMWRQADSFDAATAYDLIGPGMNLSDGDRPEQVKGIHVTADYFRVFRTTAVVGRTFSADEDRPGGPRLAILSHRLWVSRFGNDPQVVGRTIILNGDAHTVVGVLERTFRPDPDADLFIPLQPDPNSANQGHFLFVAARLRPGVSVETADAEMKVLGERFRRANPRWMEANEQATAEPLQAALVKVVRPALLILFGAVVMVLCIACANVANLLLARAAGRQREMAIRAAIGAGRRQIVRQLLVESLLLAGIAGALGLLLGVWGMRVLLALSPARLPRVEQLTQTTWLFTAFDWRVFAFTGVISLTTGILFGLAPALRLSNPAITSALREGGLGATSRHVARTRALLVVGETALAIVLLIGAILLIRTFVALRAVEPGFDARDVLTFQTSLGGNKYAATAPVADLVKRVTERLETRPGIEVAAFTITLPLEPGPDLPFRIDGRALSGDELYHGSAQWRSVSVGYFRALRVPIQRGRPSDDRDTSGTTAVVIINAAMAKKFWPNEDPIGRRIVIGQGLGPEFADAPRQIIGIVGDVREEDLAEPPVPVMYVPVPQVPDGLTRLGNNVLPMTWLVRGANVQAGASAIQREFLAVDGQLAIARVRPMEQVIRESVATRDFSMVLLTTFAAIALALAAIGIYGLMSYSVEQGVREIGVRMAIGAARPDILRFVIWRGMRLTAVGIASGVVAAAGARPHPGAVVVRRGPGGSSHVYRSPRRARPGRAGGLLRPGETRRAAGSVGSPSARVTRPRPEIESARAPGAPREADFDRGNR